MHKNQHLTWSAEKLHQRGQKQALALFHKAAVNVPAYKHFLHKNHIAHSSVKTWEDFQKVPTIDKKNYLQNYSLAQLSWDGTLKKPLVFTSTSGSTGIPFYFMRQKELDEQYATILETFLDTIFDQQSGETLIIVCFGMGVWIGGLITYKAYEIAGYRRNFPISLITPGMNKKEILNALKVLSPQFKNTVLVGYPPFIKDIIDEANDLKINIKSLHLSFHFAAEAVTEEFRDYLAYHAGVKEIPRNFISIYGSADIGAMAVENALCILIRRLAKKDSVLFKNIFDDISKTPTLSQFNPLHIFFETIDGEIVLTGNSALPLVRYAIGDHGGVISYEEMRKNLEKSNVLLDQELKKNNVQKFMLQFPFVYVYERINLATTFYGLLVYPEWIRPGLFASDVQKYLTGKFTMITKFDDNHNQYIEINLEMKKGVEKVSQKTEDMILKRIVKSFIVASSEYREIYKDLGKKALPILLFWPAEHALHFTPGIKQKWVKKE